MFIRYQYKRYDDAEPIEWWEIKNYIQGDMNEDEIASLVKEGKIQFFYGRDEDAEKGLVLGYNGKNYICQYHFVTEQPKDWKDWIPADDSVVEATLELDKKLTDMFNNNRYELSQMLKPDSGWVPAKRTESCEFEEWGGHILGR